MDSILTAVKKLLGIPEEYTQFDGDIILHINTVFMTLYQMGVGPDIPFSIEDDSSYWEDFSSDIATMQAVKSYVFMKVRLLFDPPTNGALLESLNQLIAEYEWRLNVLKDKGV